MYIGMKWGESLTVSRQTAENDCWLAEVRVGRGRQLYQSRATTGAAMYGGRGCAVPAPTAAGGGRWRGPGVVLMEGVVGDRGKLGVVAGSADGVPPARPSI